MLCQKCSTPNPASSRFCSTCGESLPGSGNTETGSGVTRGFEPSAGTPLSLNPGAILGGRYRILEGIGMGGMGMVYKALDLELSVPVALKVIRSEYSENEKILERFKKEITIARRVTHRNVARIYDFGEADGLRYISMEYIEGKDLSRLLETEGPVPPERAVVILRQCCEALAEAHAAGVVHRDLKPHNVMIDAEGNVRLMDFGIAMSQETRGLTRTGAIIGTPEYMSPEQAEGKKVDHRADIYSLGILVYEMLTGAVPFSGTTQWEVIRKHIQERPRPVRKTRAEIPAWMETLVLKCLEKDPALRYQSIAEVLRDLDRQKATRMLAAYAPKKRTWGLVAGAIAVAAVAAGLVIYLRPAPGVKAGPGGRTSVAVLPFENQTGRADLDWLRTGLAENLATDLAQSKYVRVLTRERLAQILKELGRDEASPLDTETLARIAEYGGVQAIVTGSFVGAGEVLRVNLRAQDPRTGEGIGSAAVPGREADVLAMIDQLTVRTKEILSVPRDRIAADTDTSIALARTSSVEAASLFQQGIDFLYQGRNLEAVGPLEKATAADPEFALAWARLSQAYRAVGYDAKAVEAGDKALAKATAAGDRVGTADRALVRAVHAAALNNGEEAIQAYDEMVKADPFDATAAYNLGAAYERIGQWDKAEVFFRKALEIDRNYAAAQSALGRIRIRDGRSAESLEEFQKALELYRKMGSSEGEAATYQAICNAHIDQRQWDEALTFCSKSTAIKEAIGDRRGLASSLSSEAYIRQVTGRLGQAITSASRALEIFREIGDTWGTAAALTSLGSIHEDRGDPAASAKAREEALGIWRSTGDQAAEAEVLQNLGSLRLLTGETVRAAEDLRAAGELYQSLGIEEGTAQVTSDEGIFALLKGDLAEAETLLGRALAMWQSLGSEEGVAETRARQASLALARGRYGTAASLAEGALGDYEKAGDRLNAAKSRAVAAMAWLRAGRIDDARSAADQGLAAARDLGSPVLAIALETVAVEARLQEGDPASAAPIAGSLCRSAGGVGTERASAACELQRARVAIAEGNPSAALPLAEATARRAAAAGRGLEAMEAGLVRLQALAAAGSADAAGAAQSLARQARDAGAGDVILRGGPTAVAVLAKAGRGAEAASVATLLAQEIRKAREDLEPGNARTFLERGLDPVACRAAAEALRKAGRAPEAEALAGAMSP